ncbi:unnamed protein product [Ectocarpus sp. 13 AM-2016]
MLSYCQEGPCCSLDVRYRALEGVTQSTYPLRKGTFYEEGYYRGRNTFPPPSFLWTERLRSQVTSEDSPRNPPLFRPPLASPPIKPTRPRNLAISRGSFGEQRPSSKS